MRALRPRLPGFLLLCALVLAGALAGCTGKHPDPTGSVDPCAGSKDAICTTVPPGDGHKGSIRCVVTDTAVHPVPNAVVKVKSNGKVVATTNTTSAGLCLVANLDPGTYFLEVSKRGFTTTQTTAEVQAGQVGAFVKILLQADPSSLPYFEVYDFKGHIECSLSTPYLGLAACGPLSDVGAADDSFSVQYSPSAHLTFAQSELVWTSTQASGSALSVDYAVPDGSGNSFASNSSTSPAIVKANETLLTKYVNGSATPLTVRVFSVGADGTGTNTVPYPCVPPPPSPIYACPVGGAGATIDQPFDIYTVLFYGFRPSLDYTFGKEGAPSVPA